MLTQFDLRPHIILITLRFVMFTVAFVNGHFLNRTKHNIKLYHFLPTIIAYTLYAGLRWGRGVDYNLYYYVYNEIINGITSLDYEPIFYLFVKAFGYLGIPWQIFVIFLSFILVCSGCYFLKNYRKGLIISLPFFILNIDLAENLMRWYLAFSFTLFGLYHLVRNKEIYFWIFSFIGFGIHYGFSIVIILVYLIWKLFKEKIMLHPIISFVIFMVGFILFNPEQMLIFTDFVQSINIGSRFAAYQDNAAYWLVGKDDIRIDLSYSIIVSTIYLLFLGYYLIKNNKFSRKYIPLYNLAVFGIVTQPVCSQIELLIRINTPFLVIRWILAGGIYYYVLTHRREFSLFIYCFTIFCLVYNLYSLLFKMILSLDVKNTYFIWDSNGRLTL